jgi:hypothetical protein
MLKLSKEFNTQQKNFSSEDLTMNCIHMMSSPNYYHNYNKIVDQIQNQISISFPNHFKC